MHNRPLKVIVDTVCLTRLISEDGGAHKDMQRRLGKASNVDPRVQNIGKSNTYSLKTKIRLSHTGDTLVLLHGAE